MIALVVVVGKNLPVVGAFHLPHVVENVVIKVVEAISFLSVDAIKVILPGNFRRFARIEINPDEPIAVDVDMYRKQAVPAAVEIHKFLVAWCLGKVAVETI